MRKTYLFFILLSLVGGASLQALEVRIPYALVQKEVERQMFPGGRSYLSGDSASTCDYAYVENPSVFPRAGRLAIQATFSGKTGKEVLGKCVGVGKSFDIIISGVPAYRDGLLRFDNASLEFKNSVADAIFGKLLEGYAQSLEESLTFPIQADTQGMSQLLNQGQTSYRLKVESFSIGGIEVLEPYIKLQLNAAVSLLEK